MEKVKTINVVGQDELIDDLRKIFKIFISSECLIRPHFILTGESGTGKTLAINSLCVENKIHFIEVSAAQLTKEGTSGNSLSKALSPLLRIGKSPVVIFVDEFDKLFISGNSNDSLAHESTTGVQNEFLSMLESNITSVFGDYGKYINASVENALFVFSGAFNNQKDIDIDFLRKIGVKTEFLGRVGLIYNTNKLTLDNMYQIIDENPLINYYEELFDDIDREKAILDIKTFVRDNYDMNTLGARMINTLIHQYFINGGLLSKKKINQVTFQNKLSASDFRGNSSNK